LNSFISLLINGIGKAFASFQKKKEDISDSFLKARVHTNLLNWKYLPSIGSTGGIPMGVDIDIFGIICWDVKEFSVSVIVKLKTKDVIVRVIYIYGSSYEDKKEALFLNYIACLLILKDTPL
jgi:hypothetical protein